LLDRIDLHVDVPAVSAADLALPPPAEGSAQVAARVAQARDIQRRRYDALGPEGARIGSNAEVDGEILDKVATPDAAGKKLLTRAVESFKLSARGYHRVLRVARTLSDLAGKDSIGQSEIAEALSYRRVGVGR
jgi:magnesium chelatase family protein